MNVFLFSICFCMLGGGWPLAIFCLKNYKGGKLLLVLLQYARSFLLYDYNNYDSLMLCALKFMS